MASPVYRPVSSTCTTLEERKTYAKLPSVSKGYLAEKVEYALKFPKIITIKRKDGSSYQSLLQQVVVSSAVRMDELLANYYWQYKAEVSFDMTPTILGEGPPKPFLSSGNKREGPLRRHSLNPFPPGMTVTYLRRPDVIIVKNPQVRWPGLATTDHEGHAHADNLLRVVELKFPGDTLNPEQEKAYKLIAGGGVDRLCIVDVNDCNNELEKIRQRAPVRSVEPIAEPAFYERWLTEAEQEIKPLWDTVRQGVAHLGSEVQTWLRAHVPWLFSPGRWVREASGDAYQWITESGKVLTRWTVQQLHLAWDDITKATDLAWEQITQIDWSQVIMDTVKGVCVIGICIAGVMAATTLAPVLVAALLALISINTTATA